MSDNVRSEVLDCDWGGGLQSAKFVLILHVVTSSYTLFLHYRISAAQTIKIFARVFNHKYIWYVYNHF